MNSVSASKIRVNVMKRQSEINVPVFFFLKIGFFDGKRTCNLCVSKKF